MSRLGKQPIQVPSGVEVNVADGVLTVKGPKGTLTRTLNRLVSLDITDNVMTLTPVNQTPSALALWGTFASHVHNMIKGVTEGFTKVLEIEGVGYRADVQGQKMTLNLGFSHPVVLEVPAEIAATVEKGVITLTSPDKELLGQFAANVRDVRPPEPYKGKGIRYQGEYIIRKQGKKAV